MGLGAKGMGRPKSISDAADALAKTVATLQASAGSEDEAAAVNAVRPPASKCSPKSQIIGRNTIRRNSEGVAKSFK